MWLYFYLFILQWIIKTHGHSQDEHFISGVWRKWNPGKLGRFILKHLGFFFLISILQRFRLDNNEFKESFEFCFLLEPGEVYISHPDWIESFTIKRCHHMVWWRVNACILGKDCSKNIFIQSESTCQYLSQLWGIWNYMTNPGHILEALLITT